MPKRLGGEGDTRNPSARPVPTFAEWPVWRHFEHLTITAAFVHRRVHAEQTDLNYDVR